MRQVITQKHSGRWSFIVVAECSSATGQTYAFRAKSKVTCIHDTRRTYNKHMSGGLRSADMSYDLSKLDAAYIYIYITHSYGSARVL